MRLIALEEHYASRETLDGPGHTLERPIAQKPTCESGREAASPIGAGRISEMDAAKIDMQILSLTAPGVEQLEPCESVALARQANDFLADAVGKSPRRFAGFAALPTPQPEAAAAELERTVRDHRFKGAMINGHSRGRSQQSIVLAHFGACRSSECADLPASNVSPSRSSNEHVLRRFLADGQRDAVRPRLGLAYRDRRSCAPHGSRWRVRSLSEAANRHRSHGRGASFMMERFHAMPRRPQNFNDRSSTTYVTTSITHSVGSTSLPHFSICFSRWV